MPIVEAAECGKPSVAFDIGAHPEVIGDGKLVKAGSVKILSIEIVDILKTNQQIGILQDKKRPLDHLSR
jgi:glycosyltransferase involved in cell wall biosynthesis